MAVNFNNQSFFFFLLATLSLLPLIISDNPSPPPPPPQTTVPPPQTYPQWPPKPTNLEPRKPLGTWALLQRSIGISAMHMQLLHNNKVVIFDRTDFGPSNLSLPFGEYCGIRDEFLRPDCTAHSILYDVASNSFRPLYVQTNVWCSSGAVNPTGTLVQTGGYFSGDHKIRLFTPCNDDSCDWVELKRNLTVQRWYSSNHILPDGNIIIVGGRRAYNYEFFPRNPIGSGSLSFFNLTFLWETNDYLEENNLYPFLHVLPDGNLFVFANQRSILLDYVSGRVVREFPPLPGEKRSYPSTGSSVLLPITIHENGLPISEPGSGSGAVEVMICGGAQGGSFPMAERGVYMAASRTCGRMSVTDAHPYWVMEKMPLRRVMPDMILLPNGDVLIINGAGRGTAGWENAVEPALHPVLYEPRKRLFTVLNPTRRPRMYHSSATLLPDGRILVGGSNPHVAYEFSGVNYPTDLSLESFSPPYMDERYAYYRPVISTVEYDVDESISYGQYFAIAVTMSLSGVDRRVMVTLVAPSFTTHSFAMNQRVLVLYVDVVEQVSLFEYRVTVRAPLSPNVAPPGYYMLFVVHDGIPGHAVWVRLH
ncbi:putative galactose oxidase [Helianthus annuus]|uniref:Putative glyoxal oxidase-related protein n=1 Tax=Helianthus annuus TaxID=4232 RepID=A0A251RV07_HELAN|nr:aldehyde oxidase GLOX [Helianthus annuus]KAJ0431096.1 putative galactose oxidase [Helianthus annuus]